MNIAYVEMIEDFTGGFASTAEVRDKLDPILRNALPDAPRRVDRDAWLRGADARGGQDAMMRMVRGRDR